MKMIWKEMKEEKQALSYIYKYTQIYVVGDLGFGKDNEGKTLQLTLE